MTKRNKTMKKKQWQKKRGEEQEEIAVQVTGKVVEDKETKEYKINNIKMFAKSSQTEIILTIKNISTKDTRGKRCIYKIFR